MLYVTYRGLLYYALVDAGYVLVSIGPDNTAAMRGGGYWNA